jgi:hypothetical protein
VSIIIIEQQISHAHNIISQHKRLIAFPKKKHLNTNPQATLNKSHIKTSAREKQRNVCLGFVSLVRFNSTVSAQRQKAYEQNQNGFSLLIITIYSWEKYYFWF